jgi:hypothetical protein
MVFICGKGSSLLHPFAGMVCVFRVNMKTWRSGTSSCLRTWKMRSLEINLRNLSTLSLIIYPPPKRQVSPAPSGLISIHGSEIMYEPHAS